MTSTRHQAKSKTSQGVALAVRIREWASSEKGKEVLSATLREVTDEAARLEKVQRIDPKAMLQLVTY